MQLCNAFVCQLITQGQLDVTEVNGPTIRSLKVPIDMALLGEESPQNTTFLKLWPVSASFRTSSKLFILLLDRLWAVDPPGFPAVKLEQMNDEFEIISDFDSYKLEVDWNTGVLSASSADVAVYEVTKTEQASYDFGARFAEFKEIHQNAHMAFAAFSPNRNVPEETRRIYQLQDQKARLVAAKRLLAQQIAMLRLQADEGAAENPKVAEIAQEQQKLDAMATEVDTLIGLMQLAQNMGQMIAGGQKESDSAFSVVVKAFKQLYGGADQPTLGQFFATFKNQYNQAQPISGRPETAPDAQADPGPAQ